MTTSASALRKLALAFSALVYALASGSGLAHTLDRFAGRAGLPSLGVQTLVASLTLVVTFVVVYRLMQLVWIRRIHGEWLYESTSGNCGLATIRIVGDEIRYSVDLYRSVADLLAASDGLAGANQRCFAHARSRVALYDGEKVEIVYAIAQSDPDYPSREGLLTLVHTSNPNELRGYWKSDIEGGAVPKRGTLQFMREKTFRAFVETSDSQSGTGSPA